MTAWPPVPERLLTGFAQVWTTLVGGRWERIPTAAGVVVTWAGADGRREALPDRMYGLAEATDGVAGDDWRPPGVAIHLPPGVTHPRSRPMGLGHGLTATTVAEAFGEVRRVGRQSLRRAARAGCDPTDALPDDEYLALAASKSARLGGRAPDPRLVPTLREVFGADAVAIHGVRCDGEPAAAVLSLKVGTYGLLVDGASEARWWPRCASHLAVWEAVTARFGAGCHHVDYGFSPLDAGDALFKRNLGAREVVLERLPPP